MNFHNFVTILINEGLDIGVSKAKSLYTAMGFGGQTAIYYSPTAAEQLRSAYIPVEAGEVITEFGVQLALRTESVLNLIHDGKNISAIKKIRELVRHEWGIPMVLVQARKVVEDRRVLDRAMLPEWERALLGDNWDRPLIPKD